MQRLCNICMSTVEEFLRIPTEDGKLSAPCECPVCGCWHRHRFQKYIIDKYLGISDGDISILHFAPEQWFSEYIRSFHIKEYVTADIEKGRAMICMDMTDMDMPDDSIDFFIANHVMEHILDDEKATKEIKRVLKPRGKALLSFPVYFDLEKTYEDASITSPRDRLLAFGQEDHVRKYGRDYVERYRNYGMDMMVYISDREFNENIRDKMGIISHDMIMIGTF